MLDALKALGASLSGKKTYIGVALYLGLVAAVKLGGIEIPGIVIGDNWLTLVMGALGFATLRSGISK